MKRVLTLTLKADTHSLWQHYSYVVMAYCFLMLLSLSLSPHAYAGDDVYEWGEWMKSNPAKNESVYGTGINDADVKILNSLDRSNLIYKEGVISVQENFGAFPRDAAPAATMSGTR